MKNTTYRNQCLKRQKILPILLVIVIYNFNSFRLLKIYRIKIFLICGRDIYYFLVTQVEMYP